MAGYQKVNGWETNGTQGWAWRGDPNVHRVGEYQQQNFDPRTGANYVQNAGQGTTASEMNASAQAAAQAQAAAAQAGQDNQKNLVTSNTNRTLELLRQQLGMGRQSGAGMLRQNLAQRGLLDSGSLGAGIGRLNQNYGEQMAKGTLLAANNENDQLFKMMEAEKDRGAQARMQREAMRNNLQVAQMNKPQQENPWWKLAGQGLSMLPFLV